MDFDFGETPESNRFFDRQPTFYPIFERLVRVCNICFGPRPATSLPNDIYLRLGVTCRTEFLEVLFLAANGHSIGAMKLLRGLYERAVTLAYLLKYPAKVKRFVEYAAINEYKLVQAALRIVSHAQLDEALHNTPIAEIKGRYEQYKGQFLRPNGKVASSWDIDFASQVRDVGSPFEEYYLSAYLMPTHHLHATLTSVMQPAERQPAHVQADLSLLMAHALLLKVMELHNRQFLLAIDSEIADCATDFIALWKLGPPVP
jgi:hypothetical protein